MVGPICIGSDCSKMFAKVRRHLWASKFTLGDAVLCVFNLVKLLKITKKISDAFNFEHCDEREKSLTL